MSYPSRKHKTPNPLEALYLLVMAEGFEPSTACLEGRCSIQLSYATIGVLIIPNFYFGCKINKISNGNNPNKLKTQGGP